MTTTRKLLGLIFWIALPFVAAWFGAQFTTGSWYAQLQQPTWAPPAWVFGPVWSVLYALMGVAAWLVWAQHGFGNARTALTLFLVQLLFNALWSWIFFGLRNPGLALLEIVLLWVLIVATTVAFWRKHRLAGALLVPYLLWVSFAAALNFALWRMNP
jgi:translocator protein